MKDHFDTVPPVTVIPPASLEESKAPVDTTGMAPGTARIAIRGDLALVGEHHEIWWSLPGEAFTVSADGSIYPDLRLVHMRLDTPGARLMRRQPADVRGERQPVEVTCDWTDAHAVVRQKRWLRIDPILRQLGICPDGLLTRAQWTIPSEHLKVADALCSGEILAAIAELNGAAWRDEYQQAMPHRLFQLLKPALEELKRQSDKNRAQSALELNVKRWQDAFSEASKAIGGGD